MEVCPAEQDGVSAQDPCASPRRDRTRTVVAEASLIASRPETAPSARQI